MKKKIGGFLLVGAAFAAALWAWDRNGHEPVAYRFTEVERGDIRAVVSTTGTLEAVLADLSGTDLPVMRPDAAGPAAPMAASTPPSPGATPSVDGGPAAQGSLDRQPAASGSAQLAGMLKLLVFVVAALLLGQLARWLLR